MSNQVKRNWCVLVADGSRARFFALESPDNPDIEGGPNLVEIRDLVNPEHSQTARERFANTRGSNRSPGSGRAHGYDDHRAANMEENEARFAKRVAEQLRGFVDERAAHYLVVVADPSMLGMLRPNLSFPNGIELQEHARDLSGMSASKIHAHLADADLIPRREPPPNSARGR